MRRHSWRPVRQNGSHERRRHPDGRLITVSGRGHANRELTVGVLATFRKQTGIKFHLEGLREQGETLAERRNEVGVVRVAEPA